MESVEKLAFYLLKKINKAVRNYDLIEEGDRIAVAISGGKDSLSLLKLLNLRRESVKESYHLLALHVQLGNCSGYVGGQELEEFFQAEGMEYSFEEATLLGEDNRGSEEPNYLWCSWNRRKALFLAANHLGCNKLAFGHHADDVAQTTVLNLLYHGRLETMGPRVSFFGGKIIVIRPLVYVPEKELARFSRACGFSEEGVSYPTGLISKRAKVKDLLRTIEKDCPQVKIDRFRAVQRYERRGKG